MATKRRIPYSTGIPLDNAKMQLRCTIALLEPVIRREANAEEIVSRSAQAISAMWQISEIISDVRSLVEKEFVKGVEPIRGRASFNPPQTTTRPVTGTV